jgi:sulfur carrier protein ThiS
VSLLDPQDDSGGFAERLRRKLGLPAVFPDGSSEPPFLLIEHILLRPRPDDALQLIDEGDGALPFLSEASSADPWSLQVSLVMNEALVPANTAKDPDAADNFERRVAGVFAAELPVRLHARLLWFGDGGSPSEEPRLWTDTLQAWRRFQRLLAEDRSRPALSASEDTLARLAFRDARDAVLELLAIGRPWPLRDIPLPAELVVTQGLAAVITLPFSQRGVRYELWEKDGTAPLAQGGELGREGNGSLLTLSTPVVQNDLTLRVRAVKVETAAVPRATWLRGEIRVIEGIDTTLVPFFRDLPRLAPEASAEASACLCSHGEAVIIDIPDSQNGITYDLVDRVDRDQGVAQQRSRSATSVDGNGGTVSLTYPFAAEDRDLQVRARRSQPTATGLQIALLSTILPLRVRADRAIPVALDAPVLNVGEEGVLRVGNGASKAQQGVSYQVWSQRIVDEAFFTEPFQPPPPAGVPDLAVVDAGRTIRVARPLTTAEAADLAAAGFTPLDTPREGDANLLAFAPGPARFDATLVVLATKTHRLDPLDGPTPLVGRSVVQLEEAVAQLVRPDPATRLLLVRWQQEEKSGLWRVFGGEPGVFHSFFLEDTLLGLEAYAHQRDAQPPFHLRGLGRLRIALNLAIAADPLLQAPGRQDGLPVPLVTLDLAAGDLPAKLRVRGRRAMSGLLADLDAPPLLVRVEPAIVPKGEAAKIVLTSRPQESYALESRGSVIGAPQEGDGGDLTLPTDPLEATTPLELVITPPEGERWRVPVIVPVEG